MQVLRDHLLVERIEESEISPGGIHFPNSINPNKTVKGKVRAVGYGTEDKDGNISPLEVKVGDVVFYRNESGTQMGKLTLLKEGDVFAILSD